MATAKSTTTELTSVQARIQKRLENINESTQQAAGNNISVKGQIFKLPDGKTSPGPLNCYIIDYINKNMYYPDTYVEGEFSEPICWAVHRIIKRMVPSKQGSAIQHTDCPTCEQNKFGSKGRGKACSNNVLLAILPVDFDPEEDEVLTIKVSATALKGWSNYVRDLQSMGKDPVEVVTSLTFKKGLSYPSLVFAQAGLNAKLSSIEPFMSQAEMLLTAG